MPCAEYTVLVEWNAEKAAELRRLRRKHRRENIENHKLGFANQKPKRRGVLRFGYRHFVHPSATTFDYFR